MVDGSCQFIGSFRGIGESVSDISSDDSPWTHSNKVPKCVIALEGQFNLEHHIFPVVTVLYFPYKDIRFRSGEMSVAGSRLGLFFLPLQRGVPVQGAMD